MSRLGKGTLSFCKRKTKNILAFALYDIEDIESDSLLPFCDTALMSKIVSSQAPMGSHSMRENYSSLGVDTYYQMVGSTYRNPHFPAVVAAVKCVMDCWWREEAIDRKENALKDIKVLDLAWYGFVFPGYMRRVCWMLKVNFGSLSSGSGEATLAIEAWCSQGKANASSSNISRKLGVQSCLPLDLQLVIEACDAYTMEAYKERIGREAQQITFRDIADGALSERDYDICICSFALHLLDNSNLFSTLICLSFVSRYLIVVSPHKKPVIEIHMGWELIEDITKDRVHARMYRSLQKSR